MLVLPKYQYNSEVNDAMQVRHFLNDLTPHAKKMGDTKIQNNSH